MLEESEKDQWQGVTSRNQKIKLKKFAHESLLSVENNSGVPPRRVTEVGDNWVNIRA